VTEPPNESESLDPEENAAEVPPPAAEAADAASRHSTDEYERIRVRKRTSGNRRRRGRLRATRIALFGGVAIVALGLLAVGWVLITSMMAKSELEHARANLDHFQGQVTDANLKQLRADAADIAKRADKAHELTSGPAWVVMTHVPWLGSPLKTVRGIAAQADVLASETVPQLLTLTDTLDPNHLRQADGSINLKAIEQARPVLAATVDRASATVSSVEKLPSRTWLGQVDDARSQVMRSLNELSNTLRTLNRTAGLLLPMLGSDGPKRYFIGFGNEAELRGSGGLPGSYAIAEVDNGKIKLTHFGSDDDFNGIDTGLDLGNEYNTLYATTGPTFTYQNSTVSPDFPRAGQIWAAMWKAKTGQTIDGGIMIDPTALGYLLDVTGPATMADGEQISGDNVVALTQQTLYSKFSTNNIARKQYLLDVAKTASEKLLSGSGNSANLIKAALKGANERRLAIWSADSALEAQLQDTSLSGALVQTKDPFTGFVAINAGGNKLDYYLNRKLSWIASGCGATRSTEATVTLTNNAPASGLPLYVSGRADHPDYPTKPGDNLLIVQYYATQGAKLTAASLDGKPVGLYVLSEKGHPVYVVSVELPRGTSRTLKFYTDEPNNGAPVKVLSQPGVIAEKITATAESCR
jgi:hypothetical protein